MLESQLIYGPTFSQLVLRSFSVGGKEMGLQLLRHYLRDIFDFYLLIHPTIFDTV